MTWDAKADVLIFASSSSVHCDNPILIVDDQRDARVMLAAFLRLRGYRALTAADGAEALDILRHHEPQPCLILLDLQMPVMDGETFRREQLADARISHIPVMCLSAMPDAPRRARELGAVGCLVKPVELQDLMTTVETAALGGGRRDSGKAKRSRPSDGGL